jgi:hypothetical protein
VSQARSGRPVYEPTPADRATVKNLAAVGGITHAEIARCVGTHGISEPTLRKHFRRELDVSLNEVKALAMSGLVRGLKKGDAWAVVFLLKTRAGWRETPVPESGTPATVVHIVNRVSSPADETGQW